MTPLSICSFTDGRKPLRLVDNFATTNVLQRLIYLFSRDKLATKVCFKQKRGDDSSYRHRVPYVLFNELDLAAIFSAAFRSTFFKTLFVTIAVALLTLAQTLVFALVAAALCG